MSRGPQPNSITTRVRAALPGTLAELAKKLPGFTKKQISGALNTGQTGGRVVFEGGVYRDAALPKPRRPRMIDAEDRPDTILGHGASATPAYRSDPGQSPRVFCPAFGPVALSTCLDDYATAASGHKDGRAACTRCQYGQERRQRLARGAA